VKKRLKDYARVLSIARKPTKDEFIQAAKLSGLGILIIGAIGFMVFAIFEGAKLAANAWL
jgi:protein transport protein SEC61 subunit gamma-like protein